MAAAARSVQLRSAHLPYHVRNRIQHQLRLIDLDHVSRMIRDHLPAVTRQIEQVRLQLTPDLLHFLRHIGR